jgi:type I restriction enzyme, S subunit
MKIKDIVNINESSIGKQYKYSEITYIDTSSVTEGRFEPPQLLQLKDAPSRAKRIVKHNDILLSTVRPILKHFGICKYPQENTIASTGFAVITCKKVLPEYLYRVITTKWYTEYLSIIAESQQSNFPAFNPSLIEDTEIDLPPLPTQRKIAAILSAYDDLIENNNRRIAILEKISEELYKEWFVRLRFPGHEKVKVVKGVPEGWEVKNISEIVDFLSGYSFKSDKYLSSGKYGIVTIKNVQNGYFVPEYTDFINDLPSNMKGHCLLHNGDVLMSLTGNVGRVCHIIGEDYLLNQRVAKVKPKIKYGSQFIYYTFKDHSMVQLIENLSLGSTAQMNLSPIQLGKQQLVVPGEAILLKYEETTLPPQKVIMNLLRQNSILIQTRDRFLSRLMSGKIDVEKMDIKFPQSMAEAVNA